MATSLHRRTVLATGTAGAGAAALIPAESVGRPAPERRPKQPFQHGVASGDPLPDAVVIWTRVTPTGASTPGSGKGPRATVHWQVARDAGFRNVVRRGSFETSRGRDHTVKVDVDGLEPATWYHYRFRYDGATSRVGRTRTAPAADASPKNLRFGFASCAKLSAGYFGAYRGLAERDDLHAIVHLGDYIYESGSAEVRAHQPPHEIISLADYRQRHAQHKRDPDLQDLHARYPWIVTWDDHEVANDQWRDGADAHDDATDGDFHKRRARAHRAYDEWMPARMNGTAALGDGTRLYRRLQFGTLAELSMLDLRTYRDQQVESGADPAVDDPERTITGDDQLAWLLESLDNDRARWKVIGNPVMIAPLKIAALPGRERAAVDRIIGTAPRAAAALNPDQWDGYTADRRTVLDHLQTNGVTDAVFLTGDIHGSWANDVPVDAATYPVTPSAAVEFVCTSVTSDNLDEELGLPPDSPVNAGIEQTILTANPHMKYIDFVGHGYCVLDLTPERAQCDWFVVADKTKPKTKVSWAKSFVTRTGTNAVEEVDAPVG